MGKLGNLTPKHILYVIWDYFLITFGLILYCMGWTSFLIPGGIASGGGTGICTIIYFASNGAIPVSYSFFVLNAFLLIAGFAALGKGFGFKTIYAIMVSTLLFDIVGGLIEAIGIGIVLMRGGSTGGTDILAMVVNKYWPVSPGKVYLYADLFIIASVLLVPDKTLDDMVYGYVTMVTFSFTVDWVLLGNKSSMQILIFSSRYKEIADYMINNMNRGVTALDSVGWYTGAESKVLLIICRKVQLHTIVEAVKNIDPKAFVSVSSANSVYGEGFDEIKTGLKLKKGAAKKLDNVQQK